MCCNMQHTLPCRYTYWYVPIVHDSGPERGNIPRPHLSPRYTVPRILPRFVSYVVFYAAAPSISCPSHVRVEEGEISTITFQASRSLPAKVTATPRIGDLKTTDQTSNIDVMWTLDGNDAALTLGKNIGITWNVSYIDVRCSGIGGNPAIEMNCLSFPTSSTCTTNVVKISKFLIKLKIFMCC